MYWFCHWRKNTLSSWRCMKTSKDSETKPKRISQELQITKSIFQIFSSSVSSRWTFYDDRTHHRLQSACNWKPFKEKLHISSTDKSDFLPIVPSIMLRAISLTKFFAQRSGSKWADIFCSNLVHWIEKRVTIHLKLCFHSNLHRLLPQHQFCHWDYGFGLVQFDGKIGNSKKKKKVRQHVAPGYIQPNWFLMTWRGMMVSRFKTMARMFTWDGLAMLQRLMQEENKKIRSKFNYSLLVWFYWGSFYELFIGLGNGGWSVESRNFLWHETVLKTRVESMDICLHSDVVRFKQSFLFNWSKNFELCFQANIKVRLKS